MIFPMRLVLPQCGALGICLRSQHRTTTATNPNSRIAGNVLNREPLIQSCNHSNVVNMMEKYLEITKEHAEYLYLKHPSVRCLKEGDIESYVLALYELGYEKDILIDNPMLMASLPITIKYRHQVLKECGFQYISPNHLTSFINIIKNKPIKELKEAGFLSRLLNVENHIASHMSQWPTSLTTLVHGDPNSKTLYTLRMNIMQRYLELVLELQEEEFKRGTVTYPTIKHRPVAIISETLAILQTQFKLSSSKIKSNFYLTHANPENLKKLLYKLKTLGEIDIREVIRLYPKIALKTYEALIEIQTLLNSFGISKEAQSRCLEVYTLSPNTVKERIAKAYKIPEFRVYSEHPRFLKIIYYNNTAMARLRKLYEKNKKCLSLHILSGGSVKYTSFEKSPGDRNGKGKDLLFCLSQHFGKDYSTKDIRKLINRHPFWINVPIVQVDYVFKKLGSLFSLQEIYENCPIVLYPWKKVSVVLRQLNPNINKPLIITEHIDCRSLTKSQTLSLALYLLEKHHHFSGNGVWSEENRTNVKIVPNISVI